MKRFEFLKLGLENVLAAAVRSVLTVLGMAIGVAAILAVITLGNAGRAQVQSEIGRLGIDKVLVAPRSGETISRTESELLRRKLDTFVDELVCLPVETVYGNRSAAGMLLGCSSDYAASLQPTLKAGRLLRAGEWKAGTRTALVGPGLAKTLRLAPGEWFSAGGIMFCCAGVIGRCRMAVQIDFENVILVSLAALEPWTGGRVQQLSVHVKEEQSPDDVAAHVEAILSGDAGIAATATSMQVQAEAAGSVMDVFVDVLAWVALICMLVGGIGVMNILLVSVRERRREIGIMQSLGATKLQICWLFLCEALIYAVTGGVLGLLLGGVITSVAGSSIGLVPVIRSEDCSLVFFVAVMVGLVSGVMPAVRASALRPIDALREE